METLITQIWKKLNYNWNLNLSWVFRIQNSLDLKKVSFHC